MSGRSFLGRAGKRPIAEKKDRKDRRRYGYARPGGNEERGGICVPSLDTTRKKELKADKNMEGQG